MFSPLVPELYVSLHSWHNLRETCRCLAFRAHPYKPREEDVNCASPSSDPLMISPLLPEGEHKSEATGSGDGERRRCGYCPWDCGEAVAMGAASSRPSSSSGAAAPPRGSGSWSSSMTTFNHLQDLVAQGFYQISAFCRGFMRSQRARYQSR